MKKILLVFLVCISSNILADGILKGQNHLIDGVDDYRFYIKLQSDLRPDLEKDKVRFYYSKRIINEKLINELQDLSFRQVFNLLPSQRVEVRNDIKYSKIDGEFDKRLFSGLLELLKVEQFNKYELIKLANYLESFDEVEYCEIFPYTPPPPPSLRSDNILRATPDFTKDQFYLYGDSGDDIIGIYADYAWERDITGEGVSIADVEWGWDYQHEDFKNQNVIDALTTTNHGYDDHGTAVLGEMYAEDNGFGVKGCVYGADAFYGFSEITKGRPAAIGLAIDSLEAGDVLVYEMQAPGKGNQYVPADYSQSVWDITKAATEAGIIVVAAAGNGVQNLDLGFYKPYMDRGDNGSIIVGAATKKGRNTCYFSTYGSRVNVCGIGDWSIVTTGYGNLFGNGHTSYTNNFSGTSSSTPIVASAAVMLQSYAKKIYGEIITPKNMRSILIATGTPQGSGGHIGPLPNIKKAFNAIDSIYGSTPNISNNAISFNQKITISKLTSQNITFMDIQKGNYTISIYNLAGKSILKINKELNGNSKISFENSKLTKGAYVVKVSGIYGDVIQNKIVR